jgi:hypothetical protein
MFLFHNTNMDSLKSILKDGYLKSSSILLKEGKKMDWGEGYGIYKTNNYIYFSCIDKLFSRKIHARVILYFNSKLLYNHTFFVANLHSGSPNILGEWNTQEGLSYKRKYKKHYKNYNNVLKSLFEESISRLPN